MRFQSASVGRSAGRRRPALSLAKDFSIGFRPSKTSLTVERVFRQMEQARAVGLYGLSDLVALVRAEIVKDDDVAGLEGRTQDLLDIGHEPRPVDWPGQHHWRGHPIVMQGGEESSGLPAGERDLAHCLYAARIH